jgi:GNAT superfamily N-acetyltransferase
VSTVSVRPVSGRRDLDRFIKLPFRLRRDDPQWVPPLIFERRRFLDRRRNPYFDHADAEYFLAERDGEVVGRITAQVDQRWDEFQGGSDGMFGFFEAEDDPDVARALVDAAASWVRERGRERLLGPMEFTTNDECGLLIEGFDEPSMILEPWHPPYYRELLEGVGMGKAMDVLMWELWLGALQKGDAFHDFIEEAARKSRDEHGVVVRNVSRRNLDRDFAQLMEVYNEAWGRNWGFVPITDEERQFQTKSLKPVLNENWMMAAELDGEVIGGAITLPDINQVLAKMGGRLLPFGWWHFLTGRRRIDRLRVFALGVKPQYQHLGVAAALYVTHRETAVRMPQKGGHMGWILETNEPMNRAMEGMGGKVVQRYRLYQLPLTAIHSRV